MWALYNDILQDGRNFEEYHDIWDDISTWVLMKAFWKLEFNKNELILSKSSQQIDLSAKCYFIINARAGLKHEWFNTYYGIKTNKYVQTSLIYIDVIDAQ